MDLDLRAGSILELQGQQGGKGLFRGSLEAEALEAELSQEQELFDLRHRQVQGLEERLQDLLAEEGGADASEVLHQISRETSR